MITQDDIAVGHPENCGRVLVGAAQIYQGAVSWMGNISPDNFSFSNNYRSWIFQL